MGVLSKRCRFSSKTAVLAIVVIFANQLAGCAAPSSNTPYQITNDDINFIDLDMFDSSLTSNMRVKTNEITVLFTNQPTSINELPPRLQRWLSAVHQYGGGVSVETEQGYLKKDLMSLAGVVFSGYQMLKKSMPVVMGRHYKAVIVLKDGGEGTINQIDFVRL